MQDDTVLAWLLVPVHCGNSVQIFNLVNSKLYFWTPPYWISIISKPKVTFKHLSILLISLIFSPKWGEFFFLTAKYLIGLMSKNIPPCGYHGLLTFTLRGNEKYLREVKCLICDHQLTVLPFEQWLGPDAERRRTCFFYQIKFRHGL